MMTAVSEGVILGTDVAIMWRGVRMMAIARMATSACQVDFAGTWMSARNQMGLA